MRRGQGELHSRQGFSAEVVLALLAGRGSMTSDRMSRAKATLPKELTMDTSKLTASSFTLLILNLNHMLDTGKYDSITIEEVHRHIKDRSVLRWLREIGKGDIDLSGHLDTDVYGNFEELYSNYLQNMAGGYAGDERRRWGIEKRGLCFLIAWTNEAIQLGSGWKPNADMFRTP